MSLDSQSPKPSRRGFLRGAGVALALPWMESAPLFASGLTAAKDSAPPLRLGIVYFSNGVEPIHWWAKGAGAAMEIGQGLLPMMPHREDMVFIQGLYHPLAEVSTSPHLGRMNLLSGAPVSLDPGEIRVGTSMDQVLSTRIGGRTAVPSLVLGIEPNELRLEDGLSMIYGASISWASPTRPATKEIYPSRTFDRLVGDGTGRPLDRSILDEVRQDSASLKPKISRSDRAKLDEYLESIRDIEKRIERASKEERLEGWRPTLTQPDMPRPKNELPQNVPDHMKLMLDLMVLAFQMDKTRIATLMLNNDLSQMNFRFLEGVQGALHLDLTHNLKDPAKEAMYLKTNQFHIAQFAYLTQRLKDVKEGDGSLLDHSILMLTSSLFDGDLHGAGQLPFLLTGKGNGSLKTGRVLDCLDKGNDNRKACSLHLSLMDRMGVPLDKFGDASARLGIVALQPTRARYWVIVFAVTLATIQYIDRVAISQAMPDIARDLTLSDAQKGMVFSAFTLAYALFEIPTGWLGDKLGARSVLLRVVIWWSFFTAATGWAWSYVSMLVMRFLFGAGEAGCFPNLTKALGAWLPKRDRTLAQALMWMGARWGGAFAPLLVVIVMAFVSWRMAFMAFAVLGVVWAVIFHWWFRDDPRQHSAVNAAELELLKENEVNTTGHANVPWRQLASRPALWLLWAQYFCLSYGWYFYVTWLPTYLRDERGMEIKTNAFMQLLGSGFEGVAGLFGSTLTPDLTQKLLAASLAGIPLFFGGFGSLISGMVASRFIARGATVTRVRRSIACIGFIGASTLLMTSFYIKDPLLAMLSMGLASFCNDMTMPGSWATCMDIGGKYSGTVSGSMNMMGNFGGMAGPLVVGYILSFTNRDWQLAFLISSVIYGFAAVFWLFIDPVTPLLKTSEAEPH